jgi:hypothetical protein
MIVTFGRTLRLLTESFLPYNPLITYTVLLSTALSPRQLLEIIEARSQLEIFQDLIGWK